MCLNVLCEPAHWTSCLSKLHWRNVWFEMSVSSGMIRLPKATKTPLKSKVVPRQSLATIVKDLGKNTSCGIIILLLSGLWMCVCVCASQCVVACVVVVGRLQKHFINTGHICVPYLYVLQSDRLLLLLYLQPSQLLWNWRHLEDLQHPSTGIRPASLVWAKVYWEREALTASVFCTNTHSCSYCFFLFEICLLTGAESNHQFAWQEVCTTRSWDLGGVCVLASLSPTESFLHRSTEIHVCIMIRASDHSIPLSTYHNTKNQLQPTKPVFHTHYLGRQPKCTNGSLNIFCNQF